MTSTINSRRVRHSARWRTDTDSDAGGNSYDVLTWSSSPEDSDQCYQVVIGYGDTGDGDCWWMEVQVSYAREWHTIHRDSAQSASEIMRLASAAADHPWRWTDDADRAVRMTS
jgi:hypothetical protein